MNITKRFMLLLALIPCYFLSGITTADLLEQAQTSSTLVSYTDQRFFGIANAAFSMLCDKQEKQFFIDLKEDAPAVSNINRVINLARNYHMQAAVEHLTKEETKLEVKETILPVLISYTQQLGMLKENPRRSHIPKFARKAQKAFRRKLPKGIPIFFASDLTNDPVDTPYAACVSLTRAGIFVVINDREALFHSSSLFNDYLPFVAYHEQQHILRADLVIQILLHPYLNADEYAELAYWCEHYADTVSITMLQCPQCINCIAQMSNSEKSERGYLSSPEITALGVKIKGRLCCRHEYEYTRNFYRH